MPRATLVGEMLAESAGLTEMEAMLDLALSPPLSVTFTYTEYEPEDEGMKVHEEDVAPETAVPLRYH